MSETIKYSDLTDDVQFAGSVVLSVATSALILVNSARCRSSDTLQNNRSLHDGALSSSDSNQTTYELRPRLFLWLRQLSLSGFLAIYVYSFGRDLLNSEHSNADTASSMGKRYYATHLLYLVALLGAAFFDGMNHLANQSARKSWLWLYGILFGHSFVNYLLTPTTTLLVLFLLSSLTLVFAIVCAVRSDVYPQAVPPTAEYTSSLFHYLTFAYLNAILILPGMGKASFDFAADVPTLSDADAMHCVWRSFRSILLSRQELSLWFSIYELVKYEWLAQGFFQFCGTSATYITPLALERILLHTSHGGSDDDDVKGLIPINIELAVAMLFAGPLLASVCDNQNYLRGRHIGIRIRGALIASIYNKALSVDMGASKESAGKINNLISVDVGDIQTFCCYSHMLWSCLLEIVLSSTLLYIVLGKAAFGGFSIMFVSLGMGLCVSKLVEHFQEQLLKCKDARMGIVGEVLNSMRVIKYYAWEGKFTNKINAARRSELGRLRAYAVTDAALYTFWEIIPAVVGASAFVLHTYYLGNTLTPSTGFTALTLFNLLRFPLDYFPDMLNWFVRTRVSLRRIEGFLRTPDVKGISDSCNGSGGGSGSGIGGNSGGYSDGYLHMESDSELYKDHVFAPKSYLPYANTNTSNTITTATTTTNTNSTVGTIRLTNLTLAWAPTLQEEEGGEDGESGKKGKRSTLDFAPCCARRVTHVINTNRSNTTSGTSAGAGAKASTTISKLLHTARNTTNKTYTTSGSTVYAPLSGLEDPGLEFGDEDEDDVFDSKEADILAQLSRRAGNSTGSGNSEEDGISMTDASSWSKNNTTTTATSNSNNSTNTAAGGAPTVILQNTSLFIPRGALAVVVGVTGSGKSSLLQGALLGEGVQLGGSSTVGGSISYVSQSPWIQNATLRENVLFGTPYDKDRYDAVVYSCALLSDFKLLPAGDATEIGEKGVNLSGGQQQRVSLARAAYARSDVILLDDPLSAVDALVGEHIFRELVLGFLRDRTRVLVTHNMALCVASADLVVCINSVSSSGSGSCGGNNGGGGGHSNTTSARSEVVACCPPTELNGVIQKLRQQQQAGGASTSLISNGDRKATAGSGAGDDSSGSSGGGISDLSVFLEGLVAAAALVSKECGSGSNSGSNSSKDVSSGISNSINTTGVSMSLQNPQHTFLHVNNPVSSPTSPTTPLSLAPDESPRTLLRRQNHSYESLRKGITTVNTPSNAEGCGEVESEVFAGIASDVYTADVSSAYAAAHTVPFTTPTHTTAHTAHLTTATPATASASTSSSGNITVVEGKSVGTVGWGVYWFYFKACGGVRAVAGIILGTAFTSASWLFQNIALGEWMDAMEHDGVARSTASFRTYMLSVGVVLLATMFRAVTQVTSNLISAQHLHGRLIDSVMGAPCGWFDATPVGRIVNRFSQDISTVDSSIIKNMYGFVDRLLATTQIVGIICFSLPLLLVPLLPVVVFTWWVARQYLHVSRELKRLESLKKSPVFVLFSETLQGLPIVRAFRAEGRFFRMCCDRIDDMNRCHLYLWLSNRWLSFRMQMLGALVAGAVGLAVVLEAERIGSTTAGIVLIYSLSFCEALTFLARSHADCQMDLNSIERLQEYSSLPTEKGLAAHHQNYNSANGGGSGNRSGWAGVWGAVCCFVFSDGNSGERGDGDTSMDASNHPLMITSAHSTTLDDTLHSPPASSSSSSTTLHTTSSTTWPSEGCVEFRNITLQYNSNSNPVLREVSFTIPGRTKLGVVGRTGAGKSSLIAALFRIVEPSGGELLIDGTNVLNISLHTLRNNIAIVPQDPTLFRGSVRFNLDPFDQHSDDELWAALTSAHLAEHIAAMPDTAAHSSSEGDHEDANSTNSSTGSGNGGGNGGRGSLALKLVAEKGANFSLGQRQLLCMARAILRKASVLVLDECTASVDHETDALIQETVRKELGHCTVICIAHRLHTIAYYDNVLVMDQGRTAEFAPPFELIRREGSLFRQMCVTSGDHDELYATAEQAHRARQEKS